MPKEYNIFTVFAVLILLVALIPAWTPQPVYAQPTEERSPVHNPDMYVNGTWFEGDNTTVGARYRDWHGLTWWFKEFGLRNWSQNITYWGSHALEWGTFIDTPLEKSANITLPVAVNLTYDNGTTVSLPAGSLLELPSGTPIQSFYTLGNLGGGVCVVYPDLGNLTYSPTDTGCFNETQLENFVAEGYLTGKFFRSNVTYLDTPEGKTINWYIGYTGCSNLTGTIGKPDGGEYDPNPYNINFNFDIRFDMHILRTANFTKIKSDLSLNITRLTLPGNPSNTTYGIVLRFSHMVKPVLPWGELTVNGRDFVFAAKNYNNETGTYEADGFKILDFELPENFTLYTSDGLNKTLDVKRMMFLDAKSIDRSLFDAGFFGLPYGDIVNTTRIVYDPVIIVYHPTTITPPYTNDDGGDGQEDAFTHLHYPTWWPVLVVVGAIAVGVIVYTFKRKRRFLPYNKGSNNPSRQSFGLYAYSTPKFMTGKVTSSMSIFPSWLKSSIGS